MKLEQTERTYISETAQEGIFAQRMERWSWMRAVEKLLIVGILCWAAWIQSTSAIPAGEARMRAFTMTTAGLGFDLVAWEVESVSAKIGIMMSQPGAQLSEEESTQLVRDYMARAIHMGHLERQIELLESQEELEASETTRLGELQGELMAVRLMQVSTRPVVEDVLERQIDWALRQAGLGVGGYILPPVKFAFTEPPRKVIVSPRDRIALIYTRMVRPGLPISVLETVETEIEQQPNAVGYVSNIGGLGAYPAMVVDRASLRWVLSTIAHEWAHNYLTFFPLGLFYFGSNDLTTMNETVADIVGEEIGMMVLRRYYPDLVPRPAPELDPPPVPQLVPEPDPEGRPGSEVLPPDEWDEGDELLEEAAILSEDILRQDLMEDLESEDPEEEPETEVEEEAPAFNFRFEMRETRLEVERLLGEGRIEDAEAYMEERRLLFVENGYPLRVLNQAYFAFHGSYATSPASVSPIGPKMETLRAATPNLPTFLQIVRWFTSQSDLDAALNEWAGFESS